MNQSSFFVYFCLTSFLLVCHAVFCHAVTWPIRLCLWYSTILCLKSFYLLGPWTKFTHLSSCPSKRVNWWYLNGISLLSLSQIIKFTTTTTSTNSEVLRDTWCIYLSSCPSNRFSPSFSRPTFQRLPVYFYLPGSTSTSLQHTMLRYKLDTL